MSKKRRSQKQRPSGGTGQPSAAPAFQTLELPPLAAWGFFAILVLVYFIFSTFSNGFYQHDEVGHFINMQNFWADPSAILTTWAKPGFKIVYVIPALLGSQAVLLLNCIFAALASLTSYFVAREYGMKNAFLAIFFCGFQPMLYQVAFRNYSELLTAFCIGLLLLAYAKDKHILAALLASYLFALRQELALIALIMGGIYLYRRQFIPFIALGAAPVILNIVGWIDTGNPIYLLDQIFGSGAPGEYRQLGFFHFWEMFTPAMGTTVTLFFILGYFGFVTLDNKARRDYFRKFHLAYIVFTVYFLSICLFTEEAFTFLKLTGNLRQLVVVAPVVAIFANVGFNKLMERNPFVKGYLAIVSIVFFFLLAAFLSYEYNHLKFTSVRDPSKIFVLLATFGLMGFALFNPRQIRLVALLLGLLTAGHTIYSEKPYKLSAEDQRIKTVAEWFMTNGLDEREKIVVNHTMFHYFAGTTGKERVSKYQKITEEVLEDLPAGSIVVWDSHYSYRPNSSSEPGVPFDEVQQMPDLQIVQTFIPQDRSRPDIAVVVLEKQ